MVRPRTLDRRHGGGVTAVFALSTRNLLLAGVTHINNADVGQKGRQSSVEVQSSLSVCVAKEIQPGVQADQ